MTPPLTVGLDLRMGRRAWLGGVYYLENLALAVHQAPPSERPSLLALTPLDDGDVDTETFRSVVEIVPFRDGIGDAARAAGVDVLFPTLKPPAAGPPVLPWIYDLQHLAEPDRFGWRERWYRTRAFRRAAARARAVVVSSEAMANALVSHFPSATGRVHVLRFTTVPRPEWFEGDPDAVRKRYGLPSRFVLLPGQMWVHKDHLTAFEAIRRLRDVGDPVALVCTGSMHDYRDPTHTARLRAFVADHELERHVRILGVVPRLDYVQLMRACTAVVQPSRYEGWSSIVEDTRALGKRIVMSDIAVHREQAPEHGSFFRTGDPGDLVDELAAALKSHAPTDEEAALSRQHERVIEYGRTFTAIARHAAEAE